MGDHELRRVKGDLATIQQALRLGLPFDRKDVWWTLACGLACALWAGWAFMTEGRTRYWGGVLPVGVVGVYGLRWRWLRHGGGERPAAHRRESRSQIAWGAITVVLVAAYCIWARSLAVPIQFGKGAAYFLFGAMIASYAVTDRGRWSLLGAAVPLMLGGVLIPLLALPPQIMFPASLSIGCLLMGIIMVAQLRVSGTNHATD